MISSEDNCRESWRCIVRGFYEILICYFSYGLEPGGTACTLAWWINDVFYVSYVITIFLICFVLPICIMTVCYYKAIRFITWVGDGGQQENLEWTNEKDITKV